MWLALPVELSFCKTAVIPHNNSCQISYFIDVYDAPREILEDIVLIVCVIILCKEDLSEVGRFEVRNSTSSRIDTWKKTPIICFNVPLCKI